MTWLPILARESPRGRLKRRGPRRDAKPRIDIFCEGKKTEPDYFRAYKEALGNSGAVVKIHGVGGVPDEVAEKAVKAGRVARDKRDRIWAVFDCDDHPGFDDAVALCERREVLVARSNPCFELWLVLHRKDYDRPTSSREMKEEFAALDVTFDALAASVEEAERRAAKQLERRSEEGAPLRKPFHNGGKTDLCIAWTYTLIETAKLNDVDPQAWLAQVLERIPDYKINRVDELLP